MCRVEAMHLMGSMRTQADVRDASIPLESACLDSPMRVAAVMANPASVAPAMKSVPRTSVSRRQRATPITARGAAHPTPLALKAGIRAPASAEPVDLRAPTAIRASVKREPAHKGAARQRAAAAVLVLRSMTALKLATTSLP